jgi:CheY-like chemotaxis protein
MWLEMHQQQFPSAPARFIVKEFNLRHFVVLRLQNNPNLLYFPSQGVFVSLHYYFKMPGRRLTILLIDDNYKFVERMSSLLGELAIIRKIMVASNYEEAKRILETKMPDLVLLDIRLQGQSGIELLKFIKSSERPCQVMMVTNQVDDYYRNLCKKLGANYFFDKTNDFPMIPEIIRDMKMP